MELATTIGDFYRCTNDQLKAIECTAKCGFKYLDYSFGLDYRERSGFLLSDSGKYLNDVLGKCDELNVKFVQAHAPMGSPLSDDNDVFNQVIEKFYDGEKDQKTLQLIKK